jgi:hypothetical protein
MEGKTASTAPVVGEPSTILSAAGGSCFDLPGTAQRSAGRPARANVLSSGVLHYLV